MGDEQVQADFDACDALLCEGESRDEFISENIERMEIWKKSAESGDAAGQLLYGLCFFYGHGEDEDEETAIQWFLKSAEQGNAQAQCSIGLCYQQGWGVKDDVEVANDWFAKAAVQGHKKACKELPRAIKVRMGLELYKVLTAEIAEQFLEGEDVDLSEFTAIEDDAAKVLLDAYEGFSLVGLSNVIKLAASLYHDDEDDDDYEDDEGEPEYVDDDPRPERADAEGTVTNSIGMKFVPIQAGTFLMGSPEDEEDRANDEHQHEVTLTQDFHLGMFSVTQAQYEQVMGENPSEFQGEKVSGRDSSEFPVESVSWEDAIEFCKKLSELPQEKSDGRKYRLPTEAEWEYACRAGTQTAYSFGDDQESLDKYGWNYWNSNDRSHPVGLKEPNPWGLYDMHGNVLEWCLDPYGEYPSGSVTDPVGVSLGSERVGRGGSWYNSAELCRSAYRGWPYPSSRANFFGFRVTCVPSGQ